ncbi:TPA: transcriptional regulator [Klebsiella variicola]|uniref:transcriptional regulator n=2 Tax=Klebsiella variicola TaxID=244366 RepID=UPI002852B3F7|nr:YdaS family helix-turn-helix protein [Klebsiella variicola]
MRIYQGASLSWHWSEGVLATAASGSYCAVKAFMLITSAYTQGAVWKWVRGIKKVSPVHAVAVSNAVNGVVKPHELRPDLPTLFPHPSET